MKKLLKKMLFWRIWCGPLAGMRYIGASHGSVLVPKLLGTYEIEIQRDWVALAKSAVGRVVDVGAGEGYYAIGTLFLNENTRVLAFESDPKARDLCRLLACRNKVEHRFSIQGHCGAESLLEALHTQPTALLIMDVEGAEGELLSESVASAVSLTPIIVELHEFWRPEVGKLLKDRFERTHSVREIMARQRTLRDIPARLPRVAAASLRSFGADRLSELRPPGMSWLVMIPRTSPMV
jgi:hypothetical protein